MSILCSFIIFGLWLSTLVLFLHPGVVVPTLCLPAVILLRTYLHTGLFIVAHDAAHGVVSVQNRRLNHAIGTITILFYALLPYKKFVRNHFKHHRHPATAQDPDFEAQESEFFSWYLKFMANYLDLRQCLTLLVGMSIVFYGLRGLGIPEQSLILFWIIPSLLSSLQLFYFGTFLPHRPPKTGYTNRHRTTSTYWPRFWSFLSCYYFGYHWEHHEYPQLPWFKLPSARCQNLATVPIENRTLPLSRSQ